MSIFFTTCVSWCKLTFAMSHKRVRVSDPSECKTFKVYCPLQKLLVQPYEIKYKIMTFLSLRTINKLMQVHGEFVKASRKILERKVHKKMETYLETFRLAN